MECVAHAGFPWMVVLLKYPSLFSFVVKVLQMFLYPTFRPTVSWIVIEAVVSLFAALA